MQENILSIFEKIHIIIVDRNWNDTLFRYKASHVKTNIFSGGPIFRGPKFRDRATIQGNTVYSNHLVNYRGNTTISISPSVFLHFQN